MQESGIKQTLTITVLIIVIVLGVFIAWKKMSRTGGFHDIETPVPNSFNSGSFSE